MFRLPKLRKPHLHLQAGTSRRQRSNRRPRRTLPKPTVELLEDRTVPAAIAPPSGL